MGRFSSVQAYSDSHEGNRSISYAQATGRDGGDAPKKALVKPEKVVNPYSSTAGAGSGEFHVYRHARAREMQRLEQIQQQATTDQKDAAFAQQMLEYKRQDEERTAKRRKKRQRQKEAKRRKRNLQKAGIRIDVDGTTGVEPPQQDEEFTYVPRNSQQQQQPQDAPEEPAATDADANNDDDDDKKLPKTSAGPFANDGSFLEMMKKQLAEEEGEPDDQKKEPPAKAT